VSESVAGQHGAHLIIHNIRRWRSSTSQFFGGGSGEVEESCDQGDCTTSLAAVGTVGSGGGGYGFCQHWMLNFVISIVLFGPFAIWFLAFLFSIQFGHYSKIVK
jgi:hypothetical protein